MIFNSEQQTAARQIWQRIRSVNRILLSCHASPDFDSIGSVLGLGLVLEKLEKTVTLISGDNTLPQNTIWLPNVDKIKAQKFKDLDLSKLDLFISVDTSVPGQITREIDLSFPLPIPSLVIDHHDTNSKYGEINLVVPGVGSTAEIIYDLVCAQNPKLLDKEIATCLFSGIWSDSYGLILPGVSEHTFSVISELITLGIDYRSCVYQTSSMRLQNILKGGKLLSNSTPVFSDQVLIIISESPDSGGSLSETLINQLMLCQDLKLIVIIKDRGQNECVVKFRSSEYKCNLDVSKLATELGGGGHHYMAAARVNKDSKLVEKLIIETIQKIYPSLGQP